MTQEALTGLVEETVRAEPEGRVEPAARAETVEPAAVAEPAARGPLRQLEDGQGGAGARRAPKATGRALAAFGPRRCQRTRRGGLLGGRRGALRGRRTRVRALRQRRLRGQRALGGGDQDSRA